jgi:hypothetical protein
LYLFLTLQFDNDFKEKSATYKAGINEALLNQLNKGKLVELYSALLSWEPHPELASYRISFLKNYLSLLMHFQ